MTVRKAIVAEDSSVFDPPAGSLRKAAGRGTLATGGAQGVKLVCQFASVIILSRLLAPEDFGIVAMAWPVVTFVGLFQDLGLMEATIQKKSITRGEVNSLFWVNIGLSLLLTAILVAISPIAARFYGEPAVGALVIAMSVLTIVHATAGQHYALLTRKMQFGRLALVNIVAAVVGLGVAVVWAYLRPSYWALYGGTAATAVSSTLMAWAVSSWRPSLPRLVPETRGLVHFGAGLTGFNFTNYFARNVDYILIGRTWGNQEVGLYDRAQKLLLFPLQQITNPLGGVMVPVLSRMADEPDRYRHACLRVVPILLLVTLPGVAMAVALADVLIPFALGQKWAGSAHIFQALGLAGLIQSLNSPANWMFISQGRSAELMRWGIVVAVTSVTAFVIGLPYGAHGVAVAYAASEYLRTPFLWAYLGRRGPVRAADIAGAVFPFVIGAHLALGLLWVLRPHLPQAALPTLLLGTALSYLLVIGFAALFQSGRRTLAELARLIRSRRAASA